MARAALAPWGVAGGAHHRGVARDAVAGEQGHQRDQRYELRGRACGPGRQVERHPQLSALLERGRTCEQRPGQGGAEVGELVPHRGHLPAGGCGTADPSSETGAVMASSGVPWRMAATTRPNSACCSADIRWTCSATERIASFHSGNPENFAPTCAANRLMSIRPCKAWIVAATDVPLTRLRTSSGATAKLRALVERCDSVRGPASPGQKAAHAVERARGGLTVDGLVRLRPGHDTAQLDRLALELLRPVDPLEDELLPRLVG